MERADFDQWKAREVARLLALVESERRYYQELVATLPVPLAIVSLDGFVVSANRAFRQLFHARGEDLRHLSLDKLLPVPELPAKIREAHAQATPIAPFVAACVLSGSERTLRIAVSAVRNWSDENALETVLIVEDLGDAIPPAPAVTVPSDLPAVIWQAVWQADTSTLQFQSVHGAAEALTGFPPAHWTAHADFFDQRIDSQDRARVLAVYRTAIETGGEASAEFQAVSASGALVWLRETVHATGSTLTGVLTDINRRKELERQLLTSARVDALHRLAGRLAHDLNNPLMIVQGYTEELFVSLPVDDPRRYDANEILKAAERMRTLTSQLIEFAHPQIPPAAPLDLGMVLPALEARLAETVGAGVTLELTPPGDALWGSAERTQLEDLLVALAASRAGADVTRLILSWSAGELGESVAGSTLPPRRYARITLHDNGRGVEEREM
jgi:PAS domain-containing protein